MRFPNLVLTVFLLWPTVSVSADEQGEPPRPRFEGYAYLDTEGRPLPFQSDAEIEAFLKSAEIVDWAAVPTGITIPRKLVLKGDGFEAWAVFKDVDTHRRKVTEIINGRSHFSFDWYDSYRYDIAAYELDRLLGLDRAPPVVARQIGRDMGGVSIWLFETITEVERTRDLKVEPPQVRRWNQQRLLLQVFDDLVANRDRNLGNHLIDPNWRLWFIDCTRCFGTTKAMYYPLKTIEQCERGMWRGLKTLDDDEVREHLEPYLSNAEIKALLRRRDTLIAHFRRLIDEKGEARVLYDIDPPSETAPWGDG